MDIEKVKQYSDEIQSVPSCQLYCRKPHDNHRKGVQPPTEHIETYCKYRILGTYACPQLLKADTTNR